MKNMFRKIITAFELFFSFFLLFFWKLIGLINRDPKLWIFTSWFGRSYSDNSRIFYEYVKSYDESIRCVWILKDEQLVKELNERGIYAVKTKTFQSIKLRLCASKIFSTTGGEFSLFPCNGAVLYELWHGMPLKKILYDDNFSNGSGGKKINRYTKLSLFLSEKLFVWRNMLFFPKKILVSSVFFKKILKKSFKLSDKDVFEVGLPRCDALFLNKKENLIENIRLKFPNCKIILYMPTFRDSSWTKNIFNPFDGVYGFNEKAINDVLNQKNIVLLYKAHFYDLSLMSETNSKNRIIYISDDDYSELYNFVGQCDVLMTDYSSIYFDFIITQKPVILAPFDLDEYISTCRGMYFNYSELEGIKVKNWSEFLKVISSENYKPVSDEKIKQFSEFSDGNSCKKLYELILKNKNV